MSEQQSVNSILPPPGSSKEEEDSVVVEWVAAWDEVEVRKVGITFKLGDYRVRCDKRIYSSLTPNSV